MGWTLRNADKTRDKGNFDYSGGCLMSQRNPELGRACKSDTDKVLKTQENPRENNLMCPFKSDPEVLNDNGMAVDTAIGCCWVCTGCCLRERCRIQPGISCLDG